MNTSFRALAPGFLPFLGAFQPAGTLGQIRERFGTSNEFPDWITALHTFTYCNALHQAMKRCPSAELLRGVLHGALNRAWGFRGVAAGGSLLFGLWHIASSLGLTSENVGFTRLFGGGVFGMLAGVVLAVVATGIAGFVFTWLRRRSGSLIAPIALHWSLNGVGALAAALVWHLST